MPAWRWLVIGLLFAGVACYLLVTGGIAVDKARTVFITRAADPLIYWLLVIGSGALGGLSLLRAWRQLSAR